MGIFTGDGGVLGRTLGKVREVAGETLFFLVRTADCSDRTGSFDTSAASQTGSRDLELQGPTAACACENNDDPDLDGFCGAFDSCTDSDGDGFGDPGFPANVCTEDNCPMVANQLQVRMVMSLHVT